MKDAAAAREEKLSRDWSIAGPSCPPEKEVPTCARELAGTSSWRIVTSGAQAGLEDDTLPSSFPPPLPLGSTSKPGGRSSIDSSAFFSPADVRGAVVGVAGRLGVAGAVVAGAGAGVVGTAEAEGLTAALPGRVDAVGALLLAHPDSASSASVTAAIGAVGRGRTDIVLPGRVAGRPGRRARP